MKKANTIIRRRVTVNIASRQLSYRDVDNNRWTVTTGMRAVRVGASSDTIRLKADTDVH